MMHIDRPPKRGDGVIRNTTNQLSGWLVAGGLFALWVLGDPWALQSDPGLSDDERFGPLGAAVVTLCVATVSIVAVWVFSVPHIVVTADEIIVVNPLRKWRIPRHLVASVSDGRWPVLRTLDRRRIVLLGAEQSSFMLMKGKALADQTIARPGNGGDVSWQRRVPVQVVFLISAWCAVTAFAIMFGQPPG